MLATTAARVEVRRFRLAAWTVFLVAAAVRVALVVVYPQDHAGLPGDGEHYWNRALELARGEGLAVFAPEFPRPPAFSALLALLVALLGPSLVAVPAALSLIAAGGAPILLGLGRLLRPFDRWSLVPPLAYAFDPFQVWWPRSLLAEAVVVPLFLGFVLLLAGAWPVPTAGRTAALAVAGALLAHFRVDLLPLVVLLPLATILLGRRARGRGAWRWPLAAAAILALCLPWSLAASRAAGRPVPIASPPAAGEYVRFLATFDLAPEAWQLLRAKEFERYGRRSDAGRGFGREERGLLARVAAEGLSDEVRAALERRTAERVAAAPMRYYLELPLRRVARTWLHVEGMNDPFFDPPTPGRIAFSLVSLPYVAVAWAGFLGSLAFLWRGGVVLRLAALSILLRTATLAAVSLISGWSLLEARYVAMVEPLCWLIVTFGALSLVARRRRGDEPPGAA